MTCISLLRCGSLSAICPVPMVKKNNPIVATYHHLVEKSAKLGSSSCETEVKEKNEKRNGKGEE